MAERNAGRDAPVHVRVGLNAGEPVAEGSDLFGTTVNLAARICAAADPVRSAYLRRSRSWLRARA
jgi:class 3 adenylate cyclase